MSIARCLAEQQQAARYLTDPALCAEYAEQCGCTVEQARSGASLSIFDWVAEECLIRLDETPIKHSP